MPTAEMSPTFKKSFSDLRDVRNERKIKKQVSTKEDIRPFDAKDYESFKLKQQQSFVDEKDVFSRLTRRSTITSRKKEKGPYEWKQSERDEGDEGSPGHWAQN